MKNYRPVSSLSFIAKILGKVPCSIRPCLWNELPVLIRNAQTILTFRKLLKSYLFFPTLSHPSSSAVWLIVNELCFGMKYDHAKCASELGPLMI